MGGKSSKESEPASDLPSSSTDRPVEKKAESPDLLGTKATQDQDGEEPPGQTSGKATSSKTEKEKTPAPSGVSKADDDTSREPSAILTWSNTDATAEEGGVLAPSPKENNQEEILPAPPKKAEVETTQAVEAVSSENFPSPPPPEDVMAEGSSAQKQEETTEGDQNIPKKEELFMESPPTQKEENTEKAPNIIVTESEENKVEEELKIEENIEKVAVHPEEIAPETEVTAEKDMVNNEVVENIEKEAAHPEEATPEIGVTEEKELVNNEVVENIEKEVVHQEETAPETGVTEDAESVKEQVETVIDHMIEETVKAEDKNKVPANDTTVSDENVQEGVESHIKVLENEFKETGKIEIPEGDIDNPEEVDRKHSDLREATSDIHEPGYVPEIKHNPPYILENGQTDVVEEGEKNVSLDTAQDDIGTSVDKEIVSEAVTSEVHENEIPNDQEASSPQKEETGPDVVIEEETTEIQEQTTESVEVELKQDEGLEQQEAMPSEVQAETVNVEPQEEKEQVVAVPTQVADVPEQVAEPDVPQQVTDGSEEVAEEQVQGETKEPEAIPQPQQQMEHDETREGEGMETKEKEEVIENTSTEVGDIPAGLYPIEIMWDEGGNIVLVTGSFNQWKEQIPLSPSEGIFKAVLNLPEGEHELKFIVDDEWKTSSKLEMRGENNLLIVTK